MHVVTMGRKAGGGWVEVDLAAGNHVAHRGGERYLEVVQRAGVVTASRAFFCSASVAIISVYET
jgi:hypothetical protein